MRALTKADIARGDEIRELGCAVCWIVHEVYSEPEIHHLNGQCKPGCHSLTIGLCTKHHRQPCNEKLDGKKLWLSRHGDGRKTFEKRYGTEQELLDWTNERLGL